MRRRSDVHKRYALHRPIELTDRTWPTKTIERAPRWLSTDLRDGNQALIQPMTPADKLRMLTLLLRMGYTEMDVGFPAASRLDFDFVRRLVIEDRIPDDTWVTVVTQMREEQIERSILSLIGAQRAVVGLYNATAPLFREVVFGMDRAACRSLAVRGTESGF
jgi:2-isopropylmalate synthase